MDGGVYLTDWLSDSIENNNNNMKKAYIQMYS